jgi:hypothetical protein
VSAARARQAAVAAAIGTHAAFVAAVAWSALYCLRGPLHKEARWCARGERFSAYRAAVPFMLPRWTR